MTIPPRPRIRAISWLRSLPFFQRSNHSLVVPMDTDSSIPQVDTSRWRKVDARVFGIKNSMIPRSCWTILNILKTQGFGAYLVGGCVRDLILHRAPKDFDVITTASLKQVRKQFRRAQVVGRRFPICQVWIRGSITEVSSFDTVASNSSKKEEGFVSPIKSGCDDKDLMRWKNSMHRDFTINSLFLDPFTSKIYDYANGMRDLKFLKLRTLIPARLSFRQDSARILRGLRIAARLHLSLSKDTESAIRDFSSSIESLDQARLLMEVNYMLSYGAAEASVYVLQRFNILEKLLPFQAAYLKQARETYIQSPTMLMMLLFNMDKLVSCDQPADCSLWTALLAFHTALVNHPQDALVVWAFASVLYHGNWVEGITYAKEQGKLRARFVPEILEPSEFISNEELAKKVGCLASLVQDSLGVLTMRESLFDAMSRFPDSSSSALIYVPKRKGREAAEILDELVSDIVSFEDRREGLPINYTLLGKGDPGETRLVLGKIILETMRNGVVNDIIEEEDKHKPKVAEKREHPTVANVAEKRKHPTVANVAEKRKRPTVANVAGKRKRPTVADVAEKRERATVANVAEKRGRATVANVAEKRERATVANLSRKDKRRLEPSDRESRVTGTELGGNKEAAAEKGAKSAKMEKGVGKGQGTDDIGRNEDEDMKGAEEACEKQKGGGVWRLSALFK